MLPRRSRVSMARSWAVARCASMRPRNAPAAAAATVVAALRSAGNTQGCQGPVVTARWHGRPALFIEQSESELLLMGKGDHRTRRGKIYQGSFGKSRAKDPAKKKKKAAAAAKR